MADYPSMWCVSGTPSGHGGRIYIGVIRRLEWDVDQKNPIAPSALLVHHSTTIGRRAKRVAREFRVTGADQLVGRDYGGHDRFGGNCDIERMDG